MDDLEAYLATLTPEEREEIEKLAALPDDEFDALAHPSDGEAATHLQRYRR